MHELSLATSVVETVNRHAAGRKVTSVQMKIGTMRQVVPQSLEFYFAICSKDTLCEGADFQQEIILAKLECKDCSRQWELEIPDFRCPSCSSIEVDVLAGSEFEVESIEVEEKEKAHAPH
ncbi:MAG: hydrogenase maturation nickel metallochaperone HypA [Solirubrobacterales bacterium]